MRSPGMLVLPTELHRLACRLMAFSAASGARKDRNIHDV